MPIIRTSLSIHSPESIYFFLEKRVGPLYMIVKNGQAIISFANQQHSKIALDKFATSAISGFPLNLQVYEEGDLDDKEQKEGQAIVAIPPPTAMIIEVPPMQPKISNEARMIDQALEIKNIGNPIECLIKKHRKQLIQQVATYDVLLKAASDKYNEQILKSEKEESKKEVTKQIEKMLQHKLKTVSVNLKNDLRSVSSYIKKYNTDPIEIDPIIESRPVQGVSISANQFTLQIEYINTDCNAEIKKIAALNQNEFVCTCNSNLKLKQSFGGLKVYNKFDEHQKLSISIKQGAYGLLALDNYVLVGNFQGSINFFQLMNGSEHEISQKLHTGGTIFQILFNTKYARGNSILTLGFDYFIKAWNVTEEVVTQDVSTLFFQERLSFNCDNQEIMSMDLLEEGRKVLVGSRNTMHLYDLVAKKYASETTTKSNIFKLKKMTENVVAVANTRYISFVDPRTRNCDNGFRFKTQIRAIQPLNEQKVFYGAIDGEVGSLDSRMMNVPLWNNRVNHKNRIYDICKLGDLVLTCDKDGLVVGWTGKEAIIR